MAVGVEFNGGENLQRPLKGVKFTDSEGCGAGSGIVVKTLG